MKIIKILLLFVFIISPISAFWNNDIDVNIQKTYIKFYKKVSDKYKYDKGLSYLYKLDNSLNKVNESWKLTSKNNKIVSDLHKLNNEKIFSIELSNKELENKLLINNNWLLKDYKLKFYNEDAIIKENGVWYTYIFEKKYYFENIAKVNKETLEYNWLTWDDVLVYYQWDRVTFVKEYTKKKLISDYIIYGIPNKYDFLLTLKNNKIFTTWDDDIQFKKLKEVSLNLTKWIYKNDKKIEKIYWYIVENIDYTPNFTLDDYRIFSGIETFTNKDWVCEWYVEMFNIMLAFNNIESEILTWDVINAQDFPKIWHAWVKIWDKYYDPTFDDPIWLDEDYKLEEYNYYKMPEDLFYTNRYNYWETPESIKETSLSFRENLIKRNLSKLVTKYKGKKYNILNPFYFREENSIEYNKDININDLIDILWVTKMKDFKIEENWKTKYVKNISYIWLSDSDIETFLNQVDYNLDWYTLIEWTKEDSTIEYVITNNITYH